MKPKSFSPTNILFTNQHLDLYSVIANFGDFSREYFVVKRGIRVGVILVEDDSVLLVKQYRYVINDYSWELPSGGVNEGESLEEVAVRECLEETGMRCRTLIHVYNFILGADVADSPAYIYSCNDFYPVGDFDRKEISEIKWVPFNQCLEMILSKEIQDVFTIIGLSVYAFKDRKQALLPIL